MTINIITNGLLLTEGRRSAARLRPERRQDHARRRSRHARSCAAPPRGPGHVRPDRGQRRAIAGRCRIIGGNVAPGALASYHALLDFLKAQPFAPAIDKVSFKPLIDTGARAGATTPAAPTARRIIPLAVAGASAAGSASSCMTGAGGRRASGCDSCQLDDLALDELREQTRRAGFATPDGVHMGPCEVHRTHAHTVGIAGELYKCPGFSGEATEVVGHIDATGDAAGARDRAAVRGPGRVRAVRRLPLRPGLCRRMRGRVAPRTR